MWKLQIDSVLSQYGLIRSTATFSTYTIGQEAERIFLGFTRDLGEVQLLLEMEIKKQLNGDIHLVKKKYLRNVLNKFDMLECHSVSTPLPPACKLSSEDCPQANAERSLMANVPYGSAPPEMLYQSDGGRHV